MVMVSLHQVQVLVSRLVVKLGPRMVWQSVMVMVSLELVMVSLSGMVSLEPGMVSLSGMGSRSVMVSLVTD
jgi:hypothetical protein